MHNIQNLNNAGDDHRTRIRSGHMLVVCCLASLIGIFVPTLQAAAPYYYYFGQRLPLELDGTQIAIRQTITPPAGHIAVSGPNSPALSTSIDKARLTDGWALVKSGDVQAALGTTTATPGPAVTTQNLVSAVAAEPSVGFVSPVFVDLNGGPMFITGSVLLGFQRGVSDDVKVNVLESIDGLSNLELMGHGTDNFRVELALRNGFDVLDLANRLAVEAGVSYAEPDMMFTGSSSLIPNDPDFGLCWGLRNTGQSSGLADFDMDAEEAWDITSGHASIIVVVIDNGIEQDHPDLNQVAGTDVTDQSASNPYGGPVTQWDHHGTAVGGCIAAIMNNGLGGCGVAPGVKVASARTFRMVNSSGWTSQSSWTVNAVTWAQSIGARVTCNSNGYGFSSAAIETAYQDTYAAGLVHFAAAGNGAVGSISYPASIPVVNAVAASNRAGNRSGFSQYGNGLDFIAPGESILTTDRTGNVGYGAGNYVSVNGTSFATPYAAGVAALVLSLHPTWTSAQVEAAMQASAVDMGTAGYDTSYGWGHLNARGAVSFVPAGTGADFNGDGHTDLVFYNTTTGQISIWLMNRTVISSSTILPSPSLTLSPRGTGDFDADGKSDLIMFDSSSGARKLWLMDGATVSSEVILAGANTNWVPCGSSDFNSDGKPDLIYFNPTLGQRSIWLMNGTNLSSTYLLPGANTIWYPQGSGDFNNDGKADLIFYNLSTGQRSIWLMDGTSLLTAVVQPGANTAWRLSGAGDFNGDGKADMVYFNVNTGQRSIWLMNGTTVVSSVVQPGANTAWVLRNF